MNTKEIEIQNQTLVRLLTYLSERPYREVKPLIDMLDNDIVNYQKKIREMKQPEKSSEKSSKKSVN